MGATKNILLGSVLALFTACQQLQAADPITLQGCLVSASEEIDLPARRPGVLQSLLAAPGDEFRMAELLGQIDQADSERRLADAESRAEEAKLTATSDTTRINAAGLTAGVAEYELREMEDIAEKSADAISPIEIAKARLSAQRARLDETLAKDTQTLNQTIHKRELVSVAQAKADLAATKLVAPMDGLVIKHHKDAGEWVEAGEPVLRIVRIDNVRVEGFIRERDLRQLRLNPQQLRGAEATIVVDLPAGGKAKIDGAKIYYVSPVIEPNGTCHLWAEVDNLRIPADEESVEVAVRNSIPESDNDSRWLLAPGMTAEIKITPPTAPPKPRSYQFPADRNQR